MNKKLLALPAVAMIAASSIAQTAPTLDLEGSITSAQNGMIDQINGMAPSLFGLAVVVAIFVFALNWVRRLARGK